VVSGRSQDPGLRLARERARSRIKGVSRRAALGLVLANLTHDNVCIIRETPDDPALSRRFPQLRERPE
jgi:hypothetical protein